jgi:pilus assembly protein CpaC
MQSLTSRVWPIGLIAMALVAPVAAHADARQKLHIPVGRAEVVAYSEDVRTVAIAEPKIANAAVGSARTVVVNGKAPGTTTLVIYGEGAHYTTYDIEVDVPNSEKQVQLACVWPRRIRPPAAIWVSTWSDRSRTTTSMAR